NSAGSGPFRLIRFFARLLSWPVSGSTPHLGHSLASSGIDAPHLGHIACSLSATLSRSSFARKSELSESADFLAGAFVACRRVVAAPPPSLPPSPAGTLTFVSQPGHLTAFPRAVSGAFSTFSHVGQRTLTGMKDLLVTHHPRGAEQAPV